MGIGSVCLDNSFSFHLLFGTGRAQHRHSWAFGPSEQFLIKEADNESVNPQ